MAWPSVVSNLRAKTYYRVVTLIILAVTLALPSSLALAPARAPASPLAAPHSALAHVAPAAVRPTTNNGAVYSATSGLASPTYFRNSSALAPYPVNLSGVYCRAIIPRIIQYCFPNSANPQALTLANGNIGLTYEMATTQNTTNCSANNSVATVSRIGFALSTDGGVQFSQNGLINAVGNATCPYISGMEPASTVQQNGTVDLVYVGANTTASSFTTFSGSGSFDDGYGVRTSDALIFQRSYDNGTSWTSGAVIAPNLTGTANIARPAIATFGQTIYIAYENISNGTTQLPNTYPATPNVPNHPISVNLIVSEDGGVTWKGAFNVPGENLSSTNTATSPSLAVNTSGELVVAYATNRSCYAYCNLVGAYEVSGEDVGVVTSLNNGSTFSAFQPIRKVGMPTAYGYSYAKAGFTTAVFGYAPSTSVAWDSVSGNLYVAFTGSANSSSGLTYGYDYDYDNSQVWVGASTNGGTAWTTTLLGVRIHYQTTVYYEGYFNPGLAVRNGTLYVTYTYRNYSGGGSSNFCSFGATGNGLPPAYSQWLVTSSDGVHFSHPYLAAIAPRSQGEAYYNYAGWYSSIAFNQTGSPVVGFGYETESFYGVYVYPPGIDDILSDWNVTVATVYTGPSVSVQFLENGLANGTSWAFSVNGNYYTTTANNLTVTGVPKGNGVVITSNLPTKNLAYEVIREPTGSGLATFNANGTWWFNLTTFVGFTLIPQPGNVPYMDFNLYDFTGTPSYDFYHFWETYIAGSTVGYFQGGCPFPWYLPEGFNFTWSSTYSYPKTSYYYTYAYIGYWSGTGNGSYTGATASAPITMENQAINETFWMLGGGSYGVNFHAPTLPSTSTYSFGFNGSSWSASGGSSVQVVNVTTGPHYVTDVGATSSTSGWQYFGWADNNPVVVPAAVDVNLTFAYVDTGTSAGTVSFHANGLTAGTVWQFEFNGTTYSSTTPWINITGTHSGNYPVAAFPVTAENGSTGYVPTGLAGTLSVTAGRTYSVNYTSAYQVTFVAGTGGAITGSSGSQWEAPGSVLSATAHVATGFGWLGWTGIGEGSYSGMNLSINVTANGPIVETANFLPLSAERFNLTFTETGVPSGTAWTVYVDGNGYTSTGSTLNVPNVYSCAVSGGLGRYSIVVPFAYLTGGSNLTRFVPAQYSPSVCGGTTVALTFKPQYFVTLESTPGGGVSAQSANEFSAGSAWFPGAGIAVTLQATPASGAWRFIGWNGTGSGSYTGPNAQQVVTLVGPITEFATFQKLFVPPPKTYNLTVTLGTVLAASTTWRVTVGTTGYASQGADIIVTGLAPQTYTVTVAPMESPDGLAQYTPTLASQQVVISTRDQHVTVTYSVAYWVSIGVVGPGTVAPASGWEPKGAQLTINASGIGTAVFKGWSGTGAGAYSGLLQQTTVTVNNSMSEVATFVAHPPPAGATITSIWSGTAVIAGLALVGLIVGLAVGLVIARARKGPGGGSSAASAGSASPPPEPDAEPEPMGSGAAPYAEGAPVQESYMEGPEGPSGGGSA